MPRIDEHPIVKEHVVFIEDFARRIVEEQEDVAAATAELDVALDYLTAVKTDINA